MSRVFCTPITRRNRTKEIIVTAYLNEFTGKSICKTQSTTAAAYYNTRKAPYSTTAHASNMHHSMFSQA